MNEPEDDSVADIRSILAISKQKKVRIESIPIRLETK